MLANAVYQSHMDWLIHRFREQARSHILFCVVAAFRAKAKSPDFVNCCLTSFWLSSRPMSRYLRFFLVLLLSLALPLTGMAGVPSSTEPCPMQMSGMQMMSDMSPDCCQDGATPADHGKSCKPGQECKTGGMLQLSIPVLKAPVTVSSAQLVSVSSDFIPDRTPSGVWRPPRT